MTEKNYQTEGGFSFCLAFRADGCRITCSKALDGAWVTIKKIDHPKLGQIDGLWFEVRNGRKITSYPMHHPGALADVQAHLAAIKAREAEDAAHKHTFMLLGGPEVTVDDRRLQKDIEHYAHYYGRKIEGVWEAYHKSIAGKAAEVVGQEDRTIARARQIIDVEVPRAVAAFGHVPTRSELADWQKKYNDLNNEGGEGFVPSYRTTEDVAWAEGLIAGKEE